MSTCLERIEAYLREANVSYEIQQHRRTFTAQQTAESEHVPGSLVAKVVMITGDHGLAMAVLPAPRHLDARKVAAALQWSTARVAQEWEFANAFLDCELGAMPAFGNLYELPVVVDRELTANDDIIMQAGTHTETISLPFADYQRLVEPIVAEIALPEASPATDG